MYTVKIKNHNEEMEITEEAFSILLSRTEIGDGIARKIQDKSGLKGLSVKSEEAEGIIVNDFGKTVIVDFGAKIGVVPIPVDYLDILNIPEEFESLRVNGFLSRRLEHVRKHKEKRIGNLSSRVKDLMDKTRVSKKEMKELRNFVRQRKTSVWLMGELESVLKHPKVDQIEVSKKGNILIKTSMLRVIDPDTHRESKRKKVGVFWFFLMGKEIHVFNETYHNGAHSHPTISGCVPCLGENADSVYASLNSMDIYMVVDFLIESFSVYPHTGGSPYIGWDTWMKGRRKMKNVQEYLEHYIDPVYVEFFKEGTIKI